ncbi:fimbrial protein [Atlantibacter hermannii]|nr:fimbrial protein [Atlantibacter hermannii]NBC97808.1 fimbrial protein [Atlantibacter hermannii]
MLMLSNKRFLIFIAGWFFCVTVLLFGMTTRAYAINCSAANQTPEVFTVTIPSNLSVGADIPVGSTMYRAAIIQATSTGITCDAPFNVTNYYSVSSQPSGPAFFIPMADLTGPVYPTNVPGVGVAVWFASNAFSLDNPKAIGSYSKSGAGPAVTQKSFDFSLIKTGPINPSVSVLGSSFPTVITYAAATSGYTGLPITTLRVNFNGSLNLTVPTCTINDQTIKLGSVDLKKTFTGPGSVTGWVDSSIQLKNCPTFYGFYGQSKAQGITGAGTPSGGTRRSNMITVSLNPLTDFLSINDGIFAVTGTNDDSDAAKGVGIQLGYSPDINAQPTSPTTIWKQGITWDLTMPSDGSVNLRIPLAARYYQTAARVTSGVANAKVVFTLTYK